MLSKWESHSFRDECLHSFISNVKSYESKMFASLLSLLISLSLANAANIVPFISNGDDTTINEFPFLVSIQEINVHICGGSLLNERWILSSARCISNRNINQLNVEYGNTEISPGPVGSNKAAISRIILHEDYEQRSLTNDISLLEAATIMVTNFHEPFVKLIIPGGIRFRSGTHSVHAGWGHVRQNVRTSVLQKANINILSREECVEATADTMEPSRHHICAMAESVMCTGDLGNLHLKSAIKIRSNYEHEIFRCTVISQRSSGRNRFI